MMKTSLLLPLVAAAVAFPAAFELQAATVTLDFTQPPRSGLWPLNFYRTAGSWDFSNVGTGIRSPGPGRYIYHPDGSSAPSPYSSDNSQFLNEELSLTFRNNGAYNNTLGFFTRVNPTSNLGIYAGIALLSDSEVRLSFRYDANVTTTAGSVSGLLFHEETFTLTAPLDFQPYYRLTLIQGGGDEPKFTLLFSNLQGEVIATTGEIILSAEAGSEVAARYAFAGAIGIDYVVGSQQGATLGSFHAIPEGNSTVYMVLGGVSALGLFRRQWRSASA